MCAEEVAFTGVSAAVCDCDPTSGLAAITNRTARMITKCAQESECQSLAGPSIRVINSSSDKRQNTQLDRAASAAAADNTIQLRTDSDGSGIGHGRRTTTIHTDTSAS